MLSECRVHVHTEGRGFELLSSRLGISSDQTASYLDASLSLNRLHYNITHNYYIALIIFSVVLYVFYFPISPIFLYFPVIATPVSNTSSVYSTVLPTPIYIMEKIILTWASAYNSSISFAMQPHQHCFAPPSWSLYGLFLYLFTQSLHKITNSAPPPPTRTSFPVPSFEFPTVLLHRRLLPKFPNYMLPPPAFPSLPPS